MSLPESHDIANSLVLYWAISHESPGSWLKALTPCFLNHKQLTEELEKVPMMQCLQAVVPQVLA